jgi:predicted Mrr-cat superfamily restriction endonuclease
MSQSSSKGVPFATPETREKDEAQIWMFSNQERDGDERLTNIKSARRLVKRDHLACMPSGEGVSK